jgi:Fic family protein
MTQKKWNWQLKEWPNFSYRKEALLDLEQKFSQKSGMIFGAVKHINNNDKNLFIVDIMSDEALKTSEIEGEYLNRDSIQASIRKGLGLDVDKRKIPPAEFGISEMVVDLYKNYQSPLSHEQLFEWHKMLTNGRRDLNDIGRYRTHNDEMQIVSGTIGKQRVHFEAPPSNTMHKEMEGFLKWFNEGQKNILPLARAGIAHFYLINIHPFEDGNGRIGRAIAERSIAQSINYPALLPLSQIIHNNKRAYYDALEAHNMTCEITDWLIYFGQTILDAQEHALKVLDFIIEKAKFFDQYTNELNERQIKVIKRIFDAGYEGFTGGLSADNYIKISQTSPSTATRDLQHLTEKGILLRTGERKGTRYFLNIKHNLE